MSWSHRHAGGGRDPRHRGHRGRLRDELLNGEIFYSLREAKIVIESWRRHYNTRRPHASLGYRPPAPEVFVPAFGLAGCAIPTGFAGQAPRSPKTDSQLTFTTDHTLGADHTTQKREQRETALVFRVADIRQRTGSLTGANDSFRRV